MSSIISVSHVYYPESDGKPMGETDVQRTAMVQHIEVLEDFFQGQRVYVSGDLLVYYEEGNPKKFVVPDAFVVKDLMPRPRRVYKTWAEGKSPDVVIETTSRKTKRKDTVDKPALYAALGVKEYFLFDPTDEYLEPALVGYRLVDGAYVRIAASPVGCLESRELGLKLCAEVTGLRFYNAATGERLLTRSERVEREAELAALAAQRAVQASERAAQEAERAAQEAERATQEAERAAQEAERAAAEAARADREAAARQAAEAEVARLREELARRAPPAGA